MKTLEELDAEIRERTLEFEGARDTKEARLKDWSSRPRGLRELEEAQCDERASAVTVAELVLDKVRLLAKQEEAARVARFTEGLGR
jgi:hypothetical protein